MWSWRVIRVCSNAVGRDHRPRRQRPGDLPPAHRAPARQPGPGTAQVTTLQSKSNLLHLNMSWVTSTSQQTCIRVIQGLFTDLMMSKSNRVHPDETLLFQGCDEMKGECLSSQKLSMKWCFLDCKSKPMLSFSATSHRPSLTAPFCFSGTTADRFYRIDRAQVLLRFRQTETRARYLFS